MNTAYVVAIIGGIATLVSPIATLLVKTYLDNKNYSTGGRKKKLSGQWRGVTTQSNGKVVNILVGLKSGTKILTGTAIVEFNNAKLNIRFKGYYLDENHIQINYFSLDSSIKNFGSQILRINANCTRLQGLTVGFGNEAEQIISGTTILEKI